MAWFKRFGVSVERIMTDNGSAYKSFAFRDLLAELAIRHKRTRPYTPRTNGKAERFIQTSLREWAYARPYTSSAERTETLKPWLQTYNTERTDSVHQTHDAVRQTEQRSWIRQLFNPSTTAIRMSLAQRLRSSLAIRSQSLAPSFASIHRSSEVVPLRRTVLRPC